MQQRATREFYKSVQVNGRTVIEQVATNYTGLVQRQQIAVVDSTIKNTEKVQQHTGRSI